MTPKDENKQIKLTRKVGDKVVETVLLEFLKGSPDPKIDIPYIQSQIPFDIGSPKSSRGNLAFINFDSQ